MTMLDEYSRECLTIQVGRRLSSEDVLDRLRKPLIARGLPAYLRSDNCSEFTAHRVRKWLQSLGVQTLFIEPVSPWENGYLEPFNGNCGELPSTSV